MFPSNMEFKFIKPKHAKAKSHFGEHKTVFKKQELNMF